MTVPGVRAARMHDTKRRILRRLERVSASATDAQVDQLVDYLLLLDRWNQRMNLTALADPDEAVDRLIVEPVIAAPHIDHRAQRLIDIGSGGGSPAVPLKVMRPELMLTMTEIKTRKSVFLREVSRHLALQAVTVETGRFEPVLAEAGRAGGVDAVSVRAVRVDPETLTLLAGALRPGGQILWFASGTQAAPDLPEPLSLEHEIPLVPVLQSRLWVVRHS